LVQVSGQSAEPLALDGQFLITRKELLDLSSLSSLDGRPVVAEDSNGEHYFKRLRLASDQIILESMDSGGDFEAVLLARPGSQGKTLSRIWPVAGVLFELPA
jgi:phage repressor protein C with HTH and peptisase S24 domain